MSTGPLPGFRDFYPEQYAERAFIQTTWRTVAARYGFAEYDGPPLESTELYTRKSGDEIVGQLYNFTDKGGREIALRPEMTPTLARMVSARANALPKPVRWFSIPQLFRYERAQRGRLREHFQLNVDIVGEADVRADAELVACAVDVLREFGLTHEDILVRFSDRRVLNALLDFLELAPGQHPVVYAVFDKIHRATVEESTSRLVAAGVPVNTADQLIELARHGTLAGERVEDIGERLNVPEIARLVRYQQEVGSLLGDSAEKWLTLDLSIVRGLAYYTGIVFEIFDRKGELRAVCGGGRYDGLLAAIGGTDLPALGFGMGDVVLAELLRDRGLMQSVGVPLDYWVAGDDTATRDVLYVVGKLRRKGHRVEYALRTQSLNGQLKAADRAQARFFATVRPGVPPTERILVRRLSDGVEQAMGIEQLIDTPPEFLSR
ncbi:MAG TPA: histidine--tRNA ligase [Gemmatimonadaceae bacterium]|jgi:histidyl-tRNA synthetase|nr:histidine--tRNA ligase [Gemmatimonadaceae bacterium]